MNSTQREEEGSAEHRGDPGRSAADEGTCKVERTAISTLTAGLLGGAEIALGVLALLAVLGETGDPVLAALAFTVGYIAITLSGDELFTEGFLIPIAAVVRGPASWLDVFRLWSLTLLANLAGGWLVMFLVTSAYPDLLDAAEEVAGNYLDLGVTWAGFAAAVLAGLAITLLTWIHQSVRTGRRQAGLGDRLRVPPRRSPAQPWRRGLTGDVRRHPWGRGRSTTPIGRHLPAGRCLATWSAGCCSSPSSS